MNKTIRKLKLNMIPAGLAVMLLSFFLMPNYIPIASQGDNLFHITLNGEEAGTVGSRETAQSCLQDARRKIASAAEDMIFIDAQMQLEGEEVFWGRTDSPENVTDRMVSILSGHEERTLTRCYTVRMGDYTINMWSEEDILTLLQTVLEQYDQNRRYVINLIPDENREINVLTYEVLSTSEQERKTEKAQNTLPTAGIEAQLSDFFDAVTPSVGMNFEDYDLGLQEIHFHEKIEITEAYMPENRISSLQDAIADVTGKVDSLMIHEVQAGDTLSDIAAMYGLTMNELIEVNPILENESSLIRPGDNITVTVVRPKLSVDYTMQEYYEEDYNAATIYKNNSTWFTSRQETLQEPVAGHRKVIAKVDYRDGERTGSRIIKQETMTEAVPMIIERGTIPPPTYIWPVSGGYITSGFGYRRAPKRGASTYHQGYDIGVPTGTSVMASSGGKVTQAGWLGNYGYVIFVEHPDGRQTRYGHLSKVLVRVGDEVSQGQKIALSGNTGNSTGPHLHFEVRVDGVAVSPATVLN